MMCVLKRHLFFWSVLKCINHQLYLCVIKQWQAKNATKTLFKLLHQGGEKALGSEGRVLNGRVFMCWVVSRGCWVWCVAHTHVLLTWQMFFSVIGPSGSASWHPNQPGSSSATETGRQSALAFDVYVSKHGSLLLKKDVSWDVKVASGWEKTDIISKEAGRAFIVTSFLK